MSKTTLSFPIKLAPGYRLFNCAGPDHSATSTSRWNADNADLASGCFRAKATKWLVPNSFILHSSRVGSKVYTLIPIWELSKPEHLSRCHLGQAQGPLRTILWTAWSRRTRPFRVARSRNPEIRQRTVAVR